MDDRKALDIITDENDQKIFTKTRYSYPIRDGWIKIIPDHIALPLPSSVEYRNHIPGRTFVEDVYIPKRKEIIVEGYSFGTLKLKNGSVINRWNYRISGIDSRGNFFSYRNNWMNLKAQMRLQGMHKTLLEGKKELAALVRIAHAIRLGMSLDLPTKSNLSASPKPAHSNQG